MRAALALMPCAAVRRMAINPTKRYWRMQQEVDAVGDTRSQRHRHELTREGRKRHRPQVARARQDGFPQGGPQQFRQPQGWIVNEELPVVPDVICVQNRQIGEG